MRELDFDAMASPTDELGRMKEEYIKRVSDLIRGDKIDEAINLLNELKGKLGGGSSG